MTLGERRALKYAQKQMNSFNKVIEKNPPIAIKDLGQRENPEEGSYAYDQENLQAQFEDGDMNVKNILSVSSDPPTLLRQKTCQIGPSNFFNNHNKQQKASASKESNQHGRWTDEEHQLFMEGLKLFNKDWRAIERYIGTRTCSQIRSHAQKFFMRLEKQLPTDSQMTVAGGNNSNPPENSDSSLHAPVRCKKMQSTSGLLDQTHSNLVSTHYFRDESRVDGSAESKE